MKTSTVLTYHRDWKKIGPAFEKQLDYMKSLLKPRTPQRDQILEEMASACKVSKDEMENILARPHGLRRLMTGKTQLPGHADAHRRLKSVLDVAVFINDCMSEKGITFEDVRFAFETLMKENMKYREEEDAQIKEDNNMMALFHQVLATDMENERKGRVKPDTLSEEERNAIMRLGVEAEMQKAEIWYWFRIGILKAEGLTTEQAREKVYQDLVEKGDLEGAKALRAFQDKVHLLKTNDQIPPVSSPQTPSPT